MQTIKVLIIGNGFDLDLGWKTRYSDFANSSYWPLRNSTTPIWNDLEEFLIKCKQTDKWFDLETALGEYASISKTGHPGLEEEDRKTFNKITKGLCDYLKNEEQKDINPMSAAALTLKGAISQLPNLKIYSFNYTNLKNITQRLEIYQNIHYEHVHGCLEDNSIILGVEDQKNLRHGYSFLYKTFNYHYSSHPIQYDLQEADEIIFFGHSLGNNDYHYFQSFFQAQCHEGLERYKGKKITIITYDENSRINILEQLREMNNQRTNLLFSQNNFQLICTKDKNDFKLKRFLQELYPRTY